MTWLRYAGVYLLTAIGLALAVAAIRALFGYDLSTAAQQIIPPMIAAMTEGQRYARAHGTRPTGGRAWAFAAVSTLIALGFSASGGYVASRLNPDLADLGRSVLSSPDRGLFLGLLAFMVGMVFLVNRIFYGLGARNVLRAAASPHR